MTTQPAGPHAPETAPRVPRTIDGIADALTGARRMEFYRAVGQAEAGPWRPSPWPRSSGADTQAMA